MDSDDTDAFAADWSREFEDFWNVNELVGQFPDDIATNALDPHDSQSPGPTVAVSQYCYQSNRTVIHTLHQIIGMEPTQSILLALRAKTFRDILPEPTRNEKRSKALNIQSIENHKVEILTLLESFRGIHEIFQLVFGDGKRKVEPDQLLMSWYGI
jgi:hypothetical protein